ncbi:MAG TPA: glycine cleavage system protein H [Vicinamibacterales bacterium]|jgi:glycine cleavage system H lipoate-binding protein
MGHDLITIYWLKAVEYVLALSYLPLFMLFWKFASPRQPATARVPVAALGWADQLAAFFQVPADLFFHKGHAWLRLEDADTVTVGLDDFAQKLVGPLGALRLPVVGTTLVQGQPALMLDAGAKVIPMLAPVDGTVLAVNPAALASSDIVNRSPYGDGWLMKVKTTKLAGNLRRLMSGEAAHEWMDSVCESLGAEMAGLELGKVYLDGGQMVDGVARHLSPDNWDQIAKRFFLTDQGGRRA